MSNNYINIFDTTLRDGEQAPGCGMTAEEKLRVAYQLEKLGVDIIEAGFPISSEEDFLSVKTIAEKIRGCQIAGLCRANFKDIDRGWEAVKHAERPRIHTFIATSDIHLKHKLKKSREEVLEMISGAVKHARNYTENVEFSCEDATRTDIEYLCKAVDIAVKAGASTINIPDTVGYTVPEEFAFIIRTLKEKVPGLDDVILSVHCHNDLGLAVANSLAAVNEGARQVECTINGLGERAGNASLEEIAMAVRTRQDFFNCNTDLDTSQIMTCSRLVSTITGFPVQPNKAIVGANAFAHESGIHQDGVLKSRETYEIMRAEDVGWAQNRMVMGKHSGRNAFRTRLEELDVVFDSEEELNDAFRRFKDLADKKHEIFDDDLRALVTDAGFSAENERMQLISLKVCSETGETPSASVVLAVDGTEQSGSAIGGGPVDAAFKAIESIIQSESELQLYSVNAITSGTDAQGEVTVRLQKDGRIVNGQGADTDIVIASAKAYVNAFNKLLQEPPKKHPQKSQV